MNWEEYEDADRENFSPLRHEMVTGCKECGARLTGSDEKKLKKRRKQHTTLHLRSQFYIKNLTDRIGALEEPSGKLRQRLDSLIDSLARQLHSDFKNYLRFEFDTNEVWSRLKGGQKGHFEWMVKQEWRSLEDREKEAFLKIAKEFMETVFPEIAPELKEKLPA
jgi:hypothetical protein